ncbi:hypothetical protein IJ182_11090 [bacterium]|nr:hypothetical protein [bacterium]
MTVITGIKLNDKEENSLEFQKILSKYNCDIKLRIGINNTGFLCSSTGIILLQTDNNDTELSLEKELLNISGIEIQRMIF